MRTFTPVTFKLIWLDTHHKGRTSMESAFAAFARSEWLFPFFSGFVDSEHGKEGEAEMMLFITQKGREEVEKEKKKAACQCEGTGQWCGYHGANQCECPGTDCPCQSTLDAP
jgi:hypothetical protein